jgi:hypothetical protein
MGAQSGDLAYWGSAGTSLLQNSGGDIPQTPKASIALTFIVVIIFIVV